MDSFGRLLAEGAKDFASGVYKGLDNGSTKRLTNRAIRNGNMSAEVANKIVTQRTSSQFGKLGTAAINAKPMAGIADSARQYMRTPQSQRSIMGSIKAGHMKQINGQDVLDMKKVAGTAVTVGVAGRVATGGGLYRDRYGNVNVPGLPFI